MNKKLYPLLSIGLFYLITVFYFQAEVIQNKSLPQSDVIQFEGMSKWPVDYRKVTGEEALWNEGMFAGMPDYMIATGTANPIPNKIHKIFANLLPSGDAASLFLLSVICFYILLLAFNVNPILATFGSLIYAFNTYNIINIEVGHVTKTWAIAYASLVLAGLRYSFKGKWLFGIPLTALGLAMELRADHIQITYYLVFVCVLYVLSEIIFGLKKQELGKLTKVGVMLLVVALISGGTVVCKLWISKEYAEYSIRGERLLTPESGTESKNPKEGLDKDYAFSWSQGKMESFTLLVPYFQGGGSGEKLKEGSNVYDFFVQTIGKQRTQQLIKSNGMRVPLYFGDQPFTAGPLYAGAITCFLFVLGLFVVEARHKYWMLAAALLAMFFAWGRNLEFFNYFMFDYFPMFNKFRSVSMALSMTLILMPLLGFIGLNKLLFSKFNEANQKKLFIATGVVGGLCLMVLLYGMGGNFSLEKDMATAQQLFKDNQQAISGYVSALEADRGSFLRGDAFRSLLLVLVAASLIWAAMKEKFSATITMVVIGVIAFGELWHVDKRYLYDAKFERQAIKQAHQKTPADEFILRDKDPHYRVYNLRNGFREAYTSYYHKSIGGYHAAKMRRYQDLIENRLVLEQQKLVTLLQSGQRDFSSLHSFNMLNTKYFKFGDTEREVVPNNAALGNAWFVGNVVDVSNADEEMEKLGTINTATTAVMNTKEFGITVPEAGKDSLATVSLIENAPRRIQYKSNSSRDGVVVFSEVYYPKGWIAKIDDQEVPILRANYVLRALTVPAGEHNIVFEFNPESYTTGYTITNISSYLFAILVFGGLGFAFYKESQKENSEEETDEITDSEGDDVNSQTEETKKSPKSENVRSRKNRNKKRKR